MSFTQNEIERYARQIAIEGFGESAQKKLKSAKVAVVGIGGLGCTAATMLAQAGVGDIAIIDFDIVENSNFNRQILHCQKDIARDKVASAYERLLETNPFITIRPIKAKIARENVNEILADRDIILDCLDNFEGRFILNEFCAKSRKPLIHGACYGFDGLVTTIVPGKTPCLSCIIPTETAQVKSPVIGVAPSLIGTIQASEAIKLITGIGEPLFGKMLYFDLKMAIFKTIQLEKDPNCPICGGVA